MAGVLGECPVAAALQCDGMNDGVAAGRVCWTIRSAGNRLTDCPRGFKHPCHSCEFYRRVMHEQNEQAQFRFASEPEPA